MTGLAIAVAALLILLMSGAAYMGAFHRVTIEEREVGPFTLVYREVRGNSMKQVRDVTEELDAALEAHGVTNRRPLDVFYPDDTPTEVGFAVEGPEAEAGVSGLDASVRQIPRQRSLVTEFPWRNPLSFVVGYLKVDPALAARRAEQGYAKTEALALNRGNTIQYMQPVKEEGPGGLRAS